MNFIDEVKKERLNSDISYEEYMNEELEEITEAQKAYEKVKVIQDIKSTENLINGGLSKEEEELLETTMKELQSVLLNENSTLEEKNNAYEKMKLIEETKGKEKIDKGIKENQEKVDLANTLKELKE